MPNRILRARLRQSQRWNQCCVQARDLFIRLLTLVDDFGRYEAHPVLLANECYPYGDSTGVPVPVVDICAWCADLQAHDLLTLYSISGKEFLQLTRWHERLRSQNSQFPAPSDKLPVTRRSNDSQMTVKRQSSARSQSPSQSQSLRQSPKPKPSSKPIGKVVVRFDVEEKMNPTFNALKIANRIVANDDSWAYDNCKVTVANLNARSLRTVIEPFVTVIPEKKIIAAWQQAVFTAHGAKVDNLARDAAAYAIQCFKQNLQQKASP